MHQNAKLTPAGRALLVERVLEEEQTPGEVSRALGVSRRTVYKWLSRYEAEGEAGLQDRTSRPHESPDRLPRSRVKAIRRLRKRKWTSTKIARSLSIPRSTVGVWLRRLGMGRLRDLEPKEKPIRYERSRPGELVHLDTKKFGRIGRIGHRIHGDYRRRARGVGWEFLHVCVDDATRVSYNEVLADERAVTITGFLERAVAFFAARGVTVERVMTDNGPGYISHRFADTLARLGIRHIRTRPYRPQTNGKAERFIQTAIREWAYVRPYRTSEHRTAALKHFQKHYNGQRDHSSIGDQPPLSRLRELL
jgi:transposase InsO family protein